MAMYVYLASYACVYNTYNEITTSLFKDLWQFTLAEIKKLITSEQIGSIASRGDSLE